MCTAAVCAIIARGHEESLIRAFFQERLKTGEVITHLKGVMDTVYKIATSKPEHDIVTEDSTAFDTAVNNATPVQSRASAGASIETPETRAQLELSATLTSVSNVLQRMDTRLSEVSSQSSGAKPLFLAGVPVKDFAPQPAAWWVVNEVLRAGEEPQQLEPWTEAFEAVRPTSTKAGSVGQLSGMVLGNMLKTVEHNYQPEVKGVVTYPDSRTSVVKELLRLFARQLISNNEKEAHQLVQATLIDELRRLPTLGPKVVNAIINQLNQISCPAEKIKVLVQQLDRVCTVTSNVAVDMAFRRLGWMPNESFCDLMVRIKDEAHGKYPTDTEPDRFKRVATQLLMSMQAAAADPNLEFTEAERQNFANLYSEARLTVTSEAQWAVLLKELQSNSQASATLKVKSRARTTALPIAAQQEDAVVEALAAGAWPNPRRQLLNYYPLMCAFGQNIPYMTFNNPTRPDTPDELQRCREYAEQEGIELPEL